MFTVNSKGETVRINPEEAVRFRKPEEKLRYMQLIGSILKKNFREDVDFSFAHQPLYTEEMLIFYCKTRFSPASRIVNDSLEIEKHLDEPLERLDLMRSLFQVKEQGRQCWYYLTAGMYVIERNFYDGEPINIKYVQPQSYASFLRSFHEKTITAEQKKAGQLTVRHELLGGLNINDTALLLSKAFDRDIMDGASEKDRKMHRFAEAWKKQKFHSEGEKSNIAAACLSGALIRRSGQDCFPNYRDVKNMLKKRDKRSRHIRYCGNRITGTLEDGRHIEIYVYGTQDNPEYLVGGKFVSDLDSLRKLIDENEPESEWFAEQVKPFLNLE